MPSDLIPFNQVPQHVPGRRPNVATIWRWRQRGVAGVRLRVHHVGGRVFVSLADLELFFEQVAAVKEGGVAPLRSQKERIKAIEAAERELLADGM